MNSLKLDLLAIAVHPDDAELSCSGTLVKHGKMGLKTGILDLTRGELGTRGTPEIRAQEAQDAAQVMGLAVRESLDLGDGFFQNSKQEQMAIIRVLRKYRPDTVLLNAIEDRHPDHGRSAQLEADACFMAGLRMIETEWEGEHQEAWRPKRIYHYLQDRYIKPDFVVDITEEWETKLAAIRAYKSQFYDPNSQEPKTYISSPLFLEYIEARAKEMGHAIAVRYGEGFTSAMPLAVKNLKDLL